MYRRIAILVVISTLLLAVHSDNVLKCYMCTSLSNEGCGTKLTSNTLRPVECTGNKLVEWQRSIQQHKFLNPIARLFEVDETLQYYQGAPKHMACVKMNLQVGNQDVIIRTCQTDKTDLIDPCKAMEGKVNNNLLGKIEQCTLCREEACNGTTALSSQTLNILFTLLATFIAYYYRRA